MYEKSKPLNLSTDSLEPDQASHSLSHYRFLLPQFLQFAAQNAPLSGPTPCNIYLTPPICSGQKPTPLENRYFLPQARVNRLSYLQAKLSLLIQCCKCQLYFSSPLD